MDMDMEQVNDKRNI